MTDRFTVSHAARGARGMRTILQRQLEAAIAGLPRGQPSDEEIHSARKHIKAARATLRLLRPLLSPAAFERENRALRDAGRSLGAARDGAVLLSTLQELKQQTKGADKRQQISALESRLRRDARRTRSELVRHGLRESASRLRAALSMLDSWPAAPADWKPVRRALRNTYRQGRQCAHANQRRRNGATLHEWRKRAKYLRSQLEVIAPVQHASLASMSTKLHELSDHLGDEHDLAVLSGLAGGDRRGNNQKPGGPLQKLIARKRRKLRKRALEVGLPLYAEKPRDFAARLRGYFREWS